MISFPSTLLQYPISIMKLEQMEVINGHAYTSLPQPPISHETWDFGLPFSSSSINPPIFHNQTFNLDSNDLPDWVDLLNDLPESSPNTVSSMKLPTDRNFRSTDNGNELIQAHVANERNKVVSVDLDHDYGLTLLTLLFECAVAISVDDLTVAHSMLLELTQMASPYGRSSAERVVSYFAKAMASRVLNSILGISICSPFINYKSLHHSFNLFNNISPFIKFAHFVSNQATLEAFSHHDLVHVIDLDIMHGLQWPTLLYALAMRIDGRPRHVRITAFGASMELLVQTGKRLFNIAQQLGLPFEFHPILGNVGKFDPSLMELRQGEILAVNWVQHCLYDAIGSDSKTIRFIQQLNPRIFTLVEQEMCHGEAFLDRFVGSLHYYSAIFDSLETCMISIDDDKEENGERNQVEHSHLHKEINNILAIGGPWRNGEGKFKQWRRELRKCLMEVPMSENSMGQARMMLNMFPRNEGYTLAHGECGTLKFGWKDTCLYTASSWTCFHPNNLPTHTIN